MEFDDLIGFPLAAAFFCGPLLAIYFALKLLHWNQGEKLFSNSWLVYVTWILSSILVWVFSISLNSPLMGLAGFLFANTLNIATALIVLAKVRKPVSITETQTVPTKKISNSQLWRASIAANFAAILTVVCLICVANGVGVIIEKLNPKPKHEFEIYD